VVYVFEIGPQSALQNKVAIPRSTKGRTRPGSAQRRGPDWFLFDQILFDNGHLDTPRYSNGQTAKTTPNSAPSLDSGDHPARWCVFGTTCTACGTPTFAAAGGEIQNERLLPARRNRLQNRRCGTKIAGSSEQGRLGSCGGDRLFHHPLVVLPDQNKKGGICRQGCRVDP
jgi:hypothetical protein